MSGLWSEGKIASSGIGSERSQGRERSEEEAPREPVHGMAAFRPGLSQRRIAPSPGLRGGILGAPGAFQRKA